MRYILVFVLLLLTSCVDCPPAITCIPLKPWNDIEQNNLKADIQQLPNNSMLIPAMIDYARMRSEARACNGA